MTVPLNTTTPSGFLGQTLSFVMDVVVPDGAPPFDVGQLAVTTNAPGATASHGTPVQGADVAHWTVPGTCTSPNVAGTFLLSGTINGVDDQDVSVTWAPPPTDTVVFDPNAFSFA